MEKFARSSKDMMSIIRCTGAAGRAGSEIIAVRRGPVNGDVDMRKNPKS